MKVTPGSYCFEDAHDGVVMSLKITSSNQLVSSGSDGSVKIWDLQKIMYAQVRMSITFLSLRIVLPIGAYTGCTLILHSHFKTCMHQLCVGSRC
jgi:WD40 repeat protein